VSLLAAAAVLAPLSSPLAQARAQPGASAPTQSAPPATQAAPTANAVEGVTVTADRNAPRVSIDRRSYSIANDLQATTGSVADALRNIPSVEVDVQGNVSLRGDPNVTIMIDGRPSGMFRGEGRADALQNLPADQIERVEVLTNPSAAFRPDGSGGVINLITKKNRRLGGYGSVRANVGTEGRKYGGVSGSYNTGKLTLSGDLNRRHDRRTQTAVAQRERLDPASGQWLPSTQTSRAAGYGDFTNGRGSVDYNLDAKTRLSGEVRLNRFENTSTNTEQYRGLNAAGAPLRFYDRVGTVEFERSNLEFSGSLRRKFAGDEHELVVNLSREVSDDTRWRRYTNLYRLPVQPDLYEVITQNLEETETEFQVEYKRPMPGEGKLVVGYEVDADENDYDNRGERGSAPEATAIDLNLTNHFLYERTIHSGYGTYQHPFGKLTVLGGLRLEQSLIETNQLTTGQRGENDNFSVYPSLHLSYDLTEHQDVSASVSRRVQRPGAQELNPFPIYLDAFNLRAGNPNLEPQETTSYELGWQYRNGPTTLLATAFFRDTTNSFTDVARDIGGGVILTTRENLGESRSGGLELVANGRLGRKLSYNISGTGFWNEIDASSLGIDQTRSAWSFGGRGAINWNPTPKDFFQVQGFLASRRLSAQGYTEGFGVLNLGYRRQIKENLSLVLTAQDVLESFKQRTVIETPTLRDVVERRATGRGFFIGLNYSFGSQNNRRRGPEFDFDSGGGPQ
jgi:outer membrane receptor protein involved in Fe transport